MGKIVFTNIIVHKLDNKQNKLELSSYELSDYSKIEAQLEGHIERALKHDNRKIARFLDDGNLVENACITIFKNDNAFIEQSKIIAGKLFESMKGNASPANLIICRYKEDEKSKLGLLKMDFNEIFRPIVEKIGENLKIDLELIPETLPSKNDKLQKCVFIDEDIFTKDNNEDEKYIVILDKQRNNEVSDFFSKDFLNCELINSNNENASKFIGEFIHVINEEYADNSKEIQKKVDLFKTLIKEKVGQKVSVPEMVNSVLGEEKASVVLENIGKSKKFDFEFLAEETYIKKRFSKTRYNTNIGIMLIGDEENFSTDNFTISEPNEKGEVDINIKNVKINVEE